MTGAGADVVVIGGGVIGLACAWRIAQRGATVTVVDPAPASGASHVAAGMLAPVTEAHVGEDALLRLNFESARRWPAFAAELAASAGQDIAFEEAGTLAVAFDNDDRAALEVLATHLDALGLSVPRLRSRELRTLEPMLAPTVRSGLWAAGDYRVDPRAVTAALVGAGRRHGVTLVARRVARLDCARLDGDGDGDGRPAVRGVTLDDGQRIAARSVVLAAGAAAGRLDGLTDADRPPVRPVKGQILTVGPVPGGALLGHAVRGLVRGRSVYLVPRPDGRVVVGATVEEQGWDDRPTVGAVLGLLRDATLLVPGLEEGALLEALVGFRPGTPDNAPILGPSPTTEGLVHAVGHHRNGVLLTPVTADVIAEVVDSGRAPEVAAAFAPHRFAPQAAPIGAR